MKDKTAVPLKEGGTKKLEPIDMEGNLTLPTPFKIDLRDAHAVRRELGCVYRDMRSGRIETQDGTRMAYVLDMIRKAYETGVLQIRIETLEQTLMLRGG